MTTLLELIPEPVVRRVGWMLLHFAWEGVAIAAVVGVALVLLRRGAPNTRYAVSCLGLALMAASALVTMAMVPASSLAPTKANFALPDGANRSADRAGTSQRPPVLSAVAPVVPVSPPIADPPPTSTIHRDAPRTGWLNRAISWCNGRLPWIVAGWLAGLAVLSLRLLFGWVVVQRMRRCWVEQASEGLHALLAELAARLRVSRPVRLLISARAAVPMTIGWLSPVVLLPARTLAGLTPEQWRAILAHELAHIRRWDYLANLMQSAIETLLFYHPAVWWLSRRIRVEREHCCDDAAVAVCGGSLAYAQALTELEQLRADPPRCAAAATGGVLLRRIQRLLAVEPDRSSGETRWLAGLVVVFVVVAMFVFKLNESKAEPLPLPPLRESSPIARPVDQDHVPEGHRQSLRHFVRIVIDRGAMTFQGRHTTWDALPEYLAAVPKRPSTVLELANASTDLSLRELNEARSRAAALAGRFGFEYLSYIGEHPLGSAGSPSLRVRHDDTGGEALATRPAIDKPPGALRARKEIHPEAITHLDAKRVGQLRDAPIDAEAVPLELPLQLPHGMDMVIDAHQGKLRWRGDGTEILLDVEQDNVRVAWSKGPRREELRAAVIRIADSPDPGAAVTVFDTVDGFLRMHQAGRTHLVEIIGDRVRMSDLASGHRAEFEVLAYEERPATQPAGSSPLSHPGMLMEMGSRASMIDRRFAEGADAPSAPGPLAVAVESRFYIMSAEADIDIRDWMGNSSNAPPDIRADTQTLNDDFVASMLDRALKATSIHLLSAPRLLAHDGEEGSIAIESAEKLTLPTSTRTEDGATVEAIHASGIRLMVRPVIAHSKREVTLDLQASYVAPVTVVNEGDLAAGMEVIRLLKDGQTLLMRAPLTARRLVPRPAITTEPAGRVELIAEPAERQSAPTKWLYVLVRPRMIMTEGQDEQPRNLDQAPIAPTAEQVPSTRSEALRDNPAPRRAGTSLHPDRADEAQSDKSTAVQFEIDARFVQVPAHDERWLRNWADSVGLKLDPRQATSGVVAEEEWDRLMAGARQAPESSIVDAPRLMTRDGWEAAMSTFGRISLDAAQPNGKIRSSGWQTSSGVIARRDTGPSSFDVPGARRSFAITPTQRPDDGSIDVRLEVVCAGAINMAEWLEDYGRFGPADNSVNSGQMIAVRLPLTRHRLKLNPANPPAAQIDDLYRLIREPLDVPVAVESIVYALIRVRPTQPLPAATQPASR